MEPTLDIELYETLRDPLTDSGAKTFVRLLDAKLEHVFESRKDVLATKHDMALLKTDIAELRIATREDIANLRADLRVEIAQSKAEIIKWMFIFWIGQIAVVIALKLKLL